MRDHGRARRGTAAGMRGVRHRLTGRGGTARPRRPAGAARYGGCDGRYGPVGWTCLRWKDGARTRARPPVTNAGASSPMAVWRYGWAIFMGDTYPGASAGSGRRPEDETEGRGGGSGGEDAGAARGRRHRV